MQFCFRADASIQIGSGHIMRCLTLAERLRARGADCFFICRQVPGDLIGYVESKGYPVFSIRSNVAPWGQNGEVFDSEADYQVCKQLLLREKLQIDWLIVDHYGIAQPWETAMRPHVKQIMVIDDLADRDHDCDLLLDQNYTRNYMRRYDRCVSGACWKLLGPQYLLIRPEFIEQRRKLRPRNGEVKRLMVFFGGTDPSNETFKTLQAIQLLQSVELSIEVIVGLGNPQRAFIEQECHTLANCHFDCQVEDMARRMAAADLLIGAGGTSTWERCSLGLPAITVVIAENQLESIQAVAEAGAVWNLGWYATVSETQIAQAIKALVAHPARIRDMSQKALELMGDLESGVRELLEILTGAADGH